MFKQTNQNPTRVSLRRPCASPLLLLEGSFHQVHFLAHLPGCKVKNLGATWLLLLLSNRRLHGFFLFHFFRCRINNTEGSGYPIQIILSKHTDCHTHIVLLSQTTQRLTEIHRDHPRVIRGYRGRSYWLLGLFMALEEESGADGPLAVRKQLIQRSLGGWGWLQKNKFTHK